jgi:primosomal protein N' (replication factor Y)
MLYAEVIVPRHLAHPFTYLVPPHLTTVLRIGHVVFVPFGRSVVQGAVIALSGTHPPDLDRQRLKEIRALATDGRATEISPVLFQLAKHVAETCVAPWGQCLRLVLPPRASTGDRSRLMLTKKGHEAIATKEPVAPAVLQLLKRLKRRPLGIRLSSLCGGKDRCPEEVLTWILDRGLAHKLPARSAVQARPSEPPMTASSPDLLDIQDDDSHDLLFVSYVREWDPCVEQALKNRQAVRLLVEAAPRQRLSLLRHAVTSTVAIGRQALIITGETARAESLAIALGQFGTVACLHSAMSEDKKADIWNRIRHDQVSVVVGTRSAVFLSFHSLGLIWIDREEDPAFKEPKEPRYHVRDVAWLRAQDEDAVLVLASAHLSLEATALATPEQVQRVALDPVNYPRVDVIDLRREDRRNLLSPILVEAMQEAIVRQTGLLLFLNRKAYAGALICRDCGQVPRCRACAVAFAYSRHKHSLFCHYCGASNALPDLCAACGGPRLQPIGEGTERVEEEVKRRFPSARVLRVDGETMRKPREAAATWKRIRRREWDVLVGTQLILRDDAVRPVGLVAAVQADAGLSLPDFRAAERTYHFLRDAAALARPGSEGGRLIIQSYLPSHHAIQAVVKNDETIFQSEELAHRAALGFPPLLRLIVLHISGPSEPRVDQAAGNWAARLNGLAKGLNRAGMQSDAVGQMEALTVLGPIPSPVPRMRGRYRRQILVKSRCGSAVVQAIRSSLAELEGTYPRRHVKFDVDVDPIDMW